MPALSSERTSGEPRVLLVENDGITARYVHNCLRGAGYPPPAMATTAEEALSLASVERPDVVLMDILLRGEMDGVEAAGRIRERTGAQVVFVTACGDEATRRRAMAMGPSGYLVKPFLQQELCATVGRALERPGRHRGGPVYQPLTASPPRPPLASESLPGWDANGAYEELCALAEELQRQNEELAQSQRRVEEERRRYQSLFDLAPDGYVVTDLTGVIQEANQGAGRLLGVDPVQLSGKPLSVFVPYGGHESYYQQLDHLEHDQQRRQWETPLRPRGRQPFDASLTILPIQDPESHASTLYWMIRDISTQAAAERAMRQARDSLEARVRERTAELTRLNAALQSEVAERRRTEDSLRESRRLLQSIADTAPNMLYSYDLRERSVTYTNTHVETFLGYPGDAVCGLALDASLSLVHPDDREGAERHHEQLCGAADGEVVESTLRLRHADGGWRWVRLRDVVSARDASGAPVRCVGAAEDVTEQRAAQAALVRAEKLADAGRLAASFAHEINNPLQGVLGCLGLLEEALAEGRDASRYLDVARHEVLRAVRAVGQLRDLGRQARAAVERVATDLGAIVSQVVAVTEKRTKEEIERLVGMLGAR